MPTIEIVTFPPSDSFVTDPYNFREPLTILAKAKGLIDIYYGFQHENKQVAYLFIVWETHEDHLNFFHHPQFSRLVTFGEESAAGPQDIKHVEFDADALVSLNAPVVEIVFLTPKVSMDEYNVAISALRESLLTSETCHAVSWGEFKEKKGDFMMVIGWDSVKAHYDTVQNSIFPPLIKRMYEVAELGLVHSSLLKFKPE